MLTPGRGRLALAALASTFVVIIAGAAGAAAAPAAVVIAKYAFGPAQLTVNAGDIVTWTNNDSVGHDVTSTGGPGPLKSSLLAKGQSYSLAFPNAGTFRYTCTVHPDMLGTVTVRPAATAPNAAPAQKPASAVSPPAPALSATKAVNPAAPVPPATAPPAPAVVGPVAGAPAAAPPNVAEPTEVAAAVAPAEASAGVSSDPGRARIHPLLFLAAVVTAVAVGGTITLVDRGRRPRDGT